MNAIVAIAISSAGGRFFEPRCYFVGPNTSSSSPICAKYGATISAVTSSTRGGDHFGLRSLSITAARTPSRKSSLRKTSSAARYSRTRHSSSDEALRASLSSFSVTTMPRGDFSPPQPSSQRGGCPPQPKQFQRHDHAARRLFLQRLERCLRKLRIIAG